MNNRRLASVFLSAIAALLSVSTLASAQGPAAPTELKVTDGVRLVWTAPSGTGITYVIERSGPGLTFFTQIAGPILETSYVVDTKGSEFDVSRTYTYHVRAVDSASNKGPSSNSVEVTSTRLRALPTVGNNVLDQLAVLPGFRDNSPKDYLVRTLPVETTATDTVSLIFMGVKDRTLSFTSADGSQSFSWGCVDCSFVAGPDGVGPAIHGNRGAVFKLNADGSVILVTCRAVRCEVLTAQQIETENGVLRASGDVTEHQLAADETITIPAMQRAYFKVTAR